MNKLILLAKNIPSPQKRPTISLSPIYLSLPDRERELEMRITLPVEGDNLPVILFSHGHGPSRYIPSKDGYGPLANFYAEHGFVVIQPTHANSPIGGLDKSHTDAPLFLKERYKEMSAIIEKMSDIEKSSPLLERRMNIESIAVVGHSAGAITAAMFLGMKLAGFSENEHTIPQIKAGVLLAPVGKSEDLLSSIKLKYPELRVDYSSLRTRALVVVGDKDASSHFTERGAEWHTDGFKLSPGSEHLLTLLDGKHGLGGIAGFDAKETDDEDPERLSITQRMTTAYLSSVLTNNDNIWIEACDALKSHLTGHAKVTHKGETV